MNGDTSMAPAGWYPAPDGTLRYWDGRQWVNLPQPGTVPRAAEGRASAGRSRAALRTTGIVLTALGAIPALIFVVVLVWLLIAGATSGDFASAVANYGLIPVLAFPGMLIFVAGIILLITSSRSRSTG